MYSKSIQLYWILHYGSQLKNKMREVTSAREEVMEQLYSKEMNISVDVELSIAVFSQNVTMDLIHMLNPYNEIKCTKEFIIFTAERHNDLESMFSNSEISTSNIRVFLTREFDPAQAIDRVKNSKGKYALICSYNQMPPAEAVEQMIEEIRKPEIRIVTAYEPMENIKSKVRRLTTKIMKKLSHFLLPQTADMQDPFNSIILLKSDMLNNKDLGNISRISALEFLVKENIGHAEHADVKFVSSNEKRHKPSLNEMIRNLFFMLELANYRPLRFLIVGIIGVVVNEGLLALLHIYIPVLEVISPISIEASILSNYFFNALWTFRERNRSAMRKTFSLWELIKYNTVALGGLAVNLIVLLILNHYGMEYLEANVVGIVFGFILNYLGSEKIVWKHTENTKTR